MQEPTRHFVAFGLAFADLLNIGRDMKGMEADALSDAALTTLIARLREWTGSKEATRDLIAQSVNRALAEMNRHD